MLNNGKHSLRFGQAIAATRPRHFYTSRDVYAMLPRIAISSNSATANQ